MTNRYLVIRHGGLSDKVWLGESVCGPSLIGVNTSCSGTLLKLWDTIIVLFRYF